MNRVLKSISLFNLALGILDNACNGKRIHATLTAKPYPSHPINLAIGEENITTIPKINIDIIKLVQNATSDILFNSSSPVVSCCITYF